ncbi:hypothetical protein JOC77_000554 [Peribacillus deserti]|uniref:Uncharacterized protein n=1 Tax=Peribacillus deserti TaxID=673318 RepID=A0ABS2QDD1_9BACI|nr:hypothetical protein [Peribacillus deserti]MBM7691149.1 hypothetical protein [Peribacillus deserti]
MQISLEVTMHAHGTRFLQKGVFPVNSKKFHQNPDHAAAQTAYEWIQKIKKQTGYATDTEIVKVVYNENIEITQLVKKMEYPL